VTETACRSVVLIGDSTAVGLERADLTGALGRVGATDVRLEISGGRSMVERLGDQENAVQVAQRIAASGYVGCWVVVVGANDAANIAAGSNADAATRVTRMLDAIGGQPTIWLGATSVAGSGFWARPNIESWNTQVRNLLTASGNVVFADWDAAANANPWYVSDGIHPNADGSAAMASFIGDHLLFFYPQR
jgi:lysophospholipase L1-like esterase